MKKVLFVSDDEDMIGRLQTRIDRDYPSVDLVPIFETTVEQAYQKTSQHVGEADAIFFDLIWEQDPREWPGLTYIYENLKDDIPEETLVGVLTRVGRDSRITKICREYEIPVEYTGSLWFPDGKAAIAAVMRDLGVPVP